MFKKIFFALMLVIQTSVVISVASAEPEIPFCWFTCAADQPK